MSTASLIFIIVVAILCIKGGENPHYRTPVKKKEEDIKGWPY